MQIKKDQIIECEIVDFDHRGHSIGKMDNVVVFFKGGLPGDRVSCQITKIKKGFCEGKLLEILEKSPWRIDNEMKKGVAEEGCPLLGLEYEKQLELKESKVINNLKRIAKIEEPKVNKIIPSPDIYNYRNKATLFISTDGNKMMKGGILKNNGSPKVGLYEEGSHKVIDCTDSLIYNEVAVAVGSATKRFMQEDNISAYSDEFGLGLMKYIVIRNTVYTKEIMVNYAINNAKGIPGLSKIVNYLDEVITSCGYTFKSLNLLIYKDNKFKEVINVAGERVIRDEFGHLDFEISPLSFYQINTPQAINLYDIAFQYADLKGNEALLDFYCGVGSIGLYCMKREDDELGASSVLGIDVIKDAIIDANRNAVINGIVNARFIKGRAEDVVASLEEGQGEDGVLKIYNEARVAIVDPPRKGCDKRLLDTILASKVERLVYISCDTATMSRDIAYLQKGGFDFVEATPVDMFPHTVHVECVVLIQRVK